MPNYKKCLNDFSKWLKDIKPNARLDVQEWNGTRITDLIFDAESRQQKFTSHEERILFRVDTWIDVCRVTIPPTEKNISTRNTNKITTSDIVDLPVSNEISRSKIGQSMSGRLTISCRSQRGHCMDPVTIEMKALSIKTLKLLPEINEKTERGSKRKMKLRHINPFSRFESKYFQNNNNNNNITTNNNNDVKLKKRKSEVEEMKPAGKYNDPMDDYVEIDLISAQDKARLDLFDLEGRKIIPDLKDAPMRYSISKSFESDKIEESFQRKRNRCDVDQQEIHTFFHLLNMDSVRRNTQRSTRTGDDVMEGTDTRIDRYPTDASKGTREKISAFARVDPARQVTRSYSYKGTPGWNTDSMDVSQNFRSRLNTLTVRREGDIFFLGNDIDSIRENKHCSLWNGVENHSFLQENSKFAFHI